MNIANWLARRATADPERPALYLGTDLVATYGVFERDVRAVAGALVARGIRAGDRVGIFLANCPEYLIVQYAIWYAGAVAVPVNAKLHGREAAFILEDSGAALVFAGGAQAEALAAAGVDIPVCATDLPEFAIMRQAVGTPTPVVRDPGDLAWLFYTSGTTGKPKGVMITHRMLVTMSLCYLADVDTVSDEDHTLYAAPLSHGAGIYNMLHVHAGAGHVFPLSGGFDPSEIFNLAAHFGDIHMFAAPTMVQRMTRAAEEAGHRGPGLRTVVYAGGPMYNSDIIAAVDRFGPVFVQIYGQGECPMAITALSRSDVADRDHADWAARLGSVGRAQSAVEVVIGDRDGNPLPAGSHGEIMVRGDTVMPGYWNNPQATERTLINGWLMTGDMGVLDQDGYLTLRDRSKDMIITGGSNVYPREVEEVLLTHPGVLEAAVVGRSHPEWGETVVAFVVGDVEADELDKLCIQHIARFKRPKEYRFASELPKNNYGKVLKTDLRKRLD